MKTLAFRYHPTSCNSDGNFGPEKEDDGWIRVVIEDDQGNAILSVDTAVKCLPKEAQAHIKKCVQRYAKAMGSPMTNAREVIEVSAGWGLGFTLACEEWDECETFQF